MLVVTLDGNTIECVQAGAVFGFASLVDGLINRIRDDVDGFAGDDVTVVATGHTPPLPDLHGLRQVADDPGVGRRR